MTTMTINRRQALSSAVLALALGVTPHAYAQTQRASAGNGPQEGIKVHGHWVVEVSNPDGTLADRREFENALAGGDQNLASMLARVSVPGRWELFVTSVPGDVSPCQGGTGTPFTNWCRLIESAASNPTNGTAESRDLVVTFNGDRVSITGTITALVDSVVGRVATSFGNCSASTTVANCNSAGSAVLFSDASLGFPGKPPKVPVVAGQIIKLTVTFTFS